MPHRCRRSYEYWSHVLQIGEATFHIPAAQIRPDLASRSAFAIITTVYDTNRLTRKPVSLLLGSTCAIVVKLSGSLRRLPHGLTTESTFLCCRSARSRVNYCMAEHTPPLGRSQHRDNHKNPPLKDVTTANGKRVPSIGSLFCRRQRLLFLPPSTKRPSWRLLCSAS